MKELGRCFRSYLETSYQVILKQTKPKEKETNLKCSTTPRRKTEKSVRKAGEKTLLFISMWLV